LKAANDVIIAVTTEDHEFVFRAGALADIRKQGNCNSVTASKSFSGSSVFNLTIVKALTKPENWPV
jgi:hypothetical protein